MMKRKTPGSLRFAPFAAILLLLLLPCARAVDEIKPPFGLSWNASEEQLAKLLKGAKATIADKHDVEGREAWTVEGIVQQNLRRTVFYFRNGQMVEVELQYQSADWGTSQYDDFMSQIRRRIEEKYGVGQLIARSKKPEGEVMQTIVGYKWTQGSTVLELIYYAAENSEQIYRTVSVHYKIQ
jgi:hypothetical protein